MPSILHFLENFQERLLIIIIIILLKTNATNSQLFIYQNGKSTVFFFFCPNLTILLTAHQEICLDTVKKEKRQWKSNQLIEVLQCSSVQFSSVVQSCLTLCDPMNRSTPGLPIHHHPGVHSDSRPSSPWCHPAISFSLVPFSSCPQSLPASESFPTSQLFTWGGQSTGVSALDHPLQRNPKADLLQNGLVGSPCSLRDSQESSPIPQLKSINSSALSLLQSPTLTSIHDHWKNHSLD